MENNRGILSKMFQDIVSIGSPSYQRGGAVPAPALQQQAKAAEALAPATTNGKTPQAHEAPAPTDGKVTQTTQSKAPAPQAPTAQATQSKAAQATQSKAAQATQSKAAQATTPQAPAAQNDKPGMFSSFLSNNSKNNNSKPISVKTMKLPNAPALYKRVFVISLIFCLAIYLASITFRSKTMLKKVLKLTKEKSNPDPYFDKEDESNNKRWRRVMQLIVVLNVLSIAYFIAIILAIFLIVLIYLSIAEDGEVTDKALALMKNVLWQFELNGSPYFLFYIYAIMVIIVFAAMMIFMIYHLIIKGYLGNLTYPVYVDMKKKNAKPDFIAPTKFAMHYGMYLIIIYAFFLILFSFFHLSEDALLKFAIFFVITCLMFMMLIYKYSLERSGWRISLLWVIFILWGAAVYFIV
jgi:hypothetical protein